MPVNIKLYSMSMLVAWMSMVNVFAQDGADTEKTPTASKLQIGVLFSPNAAFRTKIFNGGLGGANPSVKERTKRSETAIFGTHVGFSVSYLFSKYFGIQSGVEYSLKGWQRDYVKYNDNTYGDLYEFRREIKRYHYLDVPLALVVQSKGDKVRIGFTLGLVANVFLKGSVTNATKLKNASTVSRVVGSENAIPVNLSPLISFGWDIPFGNRFGLSIEPNFRHQLFSQESKSLEVRLWSVGLGLTCYLKP